MEKGEEYYSGVCGVGRGEGTRGESGRRVEEGGMGEWEGVLAAGRLVRAADANF